LISIHKYVILREVREPSGSKTNSIENLNFPEGSEELKD